MNNRRVSTTSSTRGRDKSLHRCAIPFCSNPSVVEGLCEMHHSRDGVADRSRTTSYAPGSSSFAPSSSVSPRNVGYGNETPDRFRAMPNLAIQPQSRANKKQKTSPDMGRHGVINLASVPNRPLSKPYSHTPLTQENLMMASRMKYTNGTSMSSYDDNPYLQGSRAPQESTTGSIQSDSENSHGDKETSLRRERNRIAARKSRQRKLDRISNLEEEKMRLEQHRDMLVQEIRSLEKKDSGVSNNAVMTITDKEYAQLQSNRMSIIQAVEEAYNSGDILPTMEYFRDDSIVSGPQNSSVHLRGKDALVLDYLCTTYLFSNINLHHVKVNSGGPRSQHFRVHWVFSGIVKSAGVSMNKEFLELIENVKGKRVNIEGVSNFSFSGEKIVYVHRTADQAKFLSSLVNISKE